MTYVQMVLPYNSQISSVLSLVIFSKVCFQGIYFHTIDGLHTHRVLTGYIRLSREDSFVDFVRRNVPASNFPKSSCEKPLNENEGRSLPHRADKMEKDCNWFAFYLFESMNY